jgi:uncharacterized protein YndB with AHSA1/START domain
MSATHISQYVRAPSAEVYRALLDPAAVARRRVPTGMRAEVHTFDAREGGSARVSLTYEAPTGAGKATAQTDTYRSRFVRLVEDEQVVEAVEFETADPALRGEMTITISLRDAYGSTEVVAVHDDLPPGLVPAAHEACWREELGKLARLVETGDPQESEE